MHIKTERSQNQVIINIFNEEGEMIPEATIIMTRNKDETKVFVSAHFANPKKKTTIDDFVLT